MTHTMHKQRNIKTNQNKKTKPSKTKEQLACFLLYSISRAKGIPSNTLPVIRVPFSF